MSIAERDAESEALRLHEQGEAPAALAVLNAAIQREPDRGSLWLVRAIVRHAGALWSDARHDAEVAMTLMPLPPGGQLVLADCYSHLGQTELALIAYQHLLEQGAHPADLYAGLYSGFRRCGRNDLAMNACRSAINAEPENHAAYFGMAHCMASLGYSANYVAAVLKSAAKLAPENDVYRTSLAIQLLRSGQPAKAHTELCRVPVERVSAVGCLCSARKLLQLCLWVGDQPRAVALSQAIRRLVADRDHGCSKPEGQDQ